MAKDFDSELEQLILKLKKAWNANEINKFLTINQSISVLFTSKIQTVIDGSNKKEYVYTYDVDSNGAEKKLNDLNDMLDKTLRKQSQLKSELYQIQRLQENIGEKNESNDKN